MSFPFQIHPKGIVLFIKVAPQGASNKIQGLWQDQDRLRLKVRVTRPPENQQATEAALKLLSQSLGLPKSSLSIVSGETNSRKSILISGDPTDLTKKIQHLLSLS